MTTDTILLATAIAAFLLGYLLATFQGRGADRLRKELQSELVMLRERITDRSSALAATQAALDAERAQGAEKLTLLQGAREEMSHQFRSLAADILDEKSRKFVELNQTTLATLLSPLQGELSGFRQKVEEVYVNESKDRSALAEQVRALSDLNGTLRNETTNLTRALKGDSKAQGDWGEMLLDRLLDSAGLMEGTHYTRQGQHEDEAGNRVIPDVVLHLPQSRHMVVDSKVTVTAYSEFAGATDEATKAEFLRAHLLSVRQHVKGLGEKNYQALYGVESLDFVVMFMPLEGAFMAALTSDRDLFQFAWDRNVLLVSPSTLLFVVRTIAHVWRQEAQSRNAQDIAERGGKLYDKFVAFAADLSRVGDSLEKAQDSYDEAFKKLSAGSGNLVGQAEKLKKLGVRATKSLPQDLVAATDPGE
jgi:DNA recombination protein RmuC